MSKKGTSSFSELQPESQPQIKKEVAKRIVVLDESMMDEVSLKILASEGNIINLSITDTADRSTLRKSSKIHAGTGIEQAFFLKHLHGVGHLSLHLPRI